MRNAGFCLTLLILFLPPQTAGGTDKGTDLTNLFLAGGVDIDRLRISESGTVVVRERTSDQALADRLADEAIDRFAVAGLRRARELRGCTFAVETRRGIVYLLGEVDREPQKDFAVQLVAGIDGVKLVKSGLTRRRIADRNEP